MNKRKKFLAVLFVMLIVLQSIFVNEVLGYQDQAASAESQNIPLVSPTSTTVPVVVTLPPKGYVDKPVNNQVISGAFNIWGWFLDGSGVAKVEVLIDSALVGTAVYGDSRPDVMNVYPAYNNFNSGFHYILDTKALTNGSHKIAVRETGKNGIQTMLPVKTITVSNPTPTPTNTCTPTPTSTPIPAKGYLDYPVNNQTLSGTYKVAGWFLDGSGVAKVEVLIDSALVATAVYGDARTDVMNVYPAYNNFNSGFHYMLDTKTLTNGSHKIAVRETGKNGTQTMLPVKTITIANLIPTSTPLPAVGFLDNPKNGQTVSGICRVWGWFLDGNGISRIEVVVDGIAYGEAVYGDPRPDVKTVYPAYNNGNAGFHYDLNTKILANGSHTVGIREIDNKFNKNTLPSRTVTVKNIIPVPQGLKFTSKTDKTVTLKWEVSPESVGIKEYNIYNNDVFIASTSETEYTVGGLKPYTTYSFTVKAKDIVGDQSSPSTRLNVMTDIGRFVSIAGGPSFTAALHEDGTVWTWGDNFNSQLGDGTYDSRNNPQRVMGLSGVISIAAGEGFCLALKNDGTVWGWGFNCYGQLGDGTNYSRRYPIKVPIKDVKAISAYNDFCIAVKKDGTVWTWGESSYSKSIPQIVNGLSDVASVSCGMYFKLALKNDGTIWAWGELNESGQLGNGTTESQSDPAQVHGLTGVTAIDSGSEHCLALKNDGTVWSWGANNNGQLGDGTTEDRFYPVQVSGITGIKAIAAGDSFSSALKNDGTIFAWGNNCNGQLGDGTNENKTAPVSVSDVTDAAGVWASNYSSYCIKNDNTLWAWGSNYRGQLGDGTDLDRNTPVEVEFETRIPSEPVNLTVSLKDGLKAVLSWEPSEDNNNDVQGYEIYRDGIKIGTTETTSYEDSSLIKTGINSHSYTVRAFDSYNNFSGPSNVAKVNISETNIKASSTSSSVTLEWNKAEGAVNYDVEVNGNLKYSTTENTCVINQLASESQSNFKVTAKNQAGSALWSKSVSSATKPAYTESWTTRAQIPAANCVGAAAVNNKIYAATYSDNQVTIHEYTPENDTWITKASNSLPGYEVKVAEVNGKIYALAYDVKYDNDYLTVFEYDQNTDTWTKRSGTSTWGSMVDFSVTVSSGKIYVMGGLQSDGVSGEVEEYDPTTDTWNDRTGMEWKALYGTADLNGKIYAVGGVNYHFCSPPYSINYVEEYDPSTEKVTEKGSLQTKRCLNGTAVLNGKIYTFGGFDSYDDTSNYYFDIVADTLDSVEQYDPSTGQWKTITKMPVKREGMVTVVLNGKVYLIGGEAVYPWNKSPVPVCLVEEFEPGVY